MAWYASLAIVETRCTMPGRYLKPLRETDEALVDGRGRPGFLVVFDIEGSTARKSGGGVPWLHETALLYRAFQRWRDEVRKLVPTQRPIHAKLIGDALMLFVPLGEKPTSDECAHVLAAVQAFRLEIHADPDALLTGVRLKTVLAFLANVCEVGGEWIGRGVDFAFRLEKRAAADRIVVNEKFVARLGQAQAERLGFVVKPGVLRDAKGFAPRESFFALVDPVRPPRRRPSPKRVVTARTRRPGVRR